MNNLAETQERSKLKEASDAVLAGIFACPEPEEEPTYVRYLRSLSRKDREELVFRDLLTVAGKDGFVYWFAGAYHAAAPILVEAARRLSEMETEDVAGTVLVEELPRVVETAVAVAAYPEDLRYCTERLRLLIMWGLDEIVEDYLSDLTS